MKKFKKGKMLAKGGAAAASVAVIVTVVLKMLGVEDVDETTITTAISGIVFVAACLKNWWKNR